MLQSIALPNSHVVYADVPFYGFLEVNAYWHNFNFSITDQDNINIFEQQGLFLAILDFQAASFKDLRFPVKPLAHTLQFHDSRVFCLAAFNRIPAVLMVFSSRYQTYRILPGKLRKSDFGYYYHPYTAEVKFHSNDWRTVDELVTHISYFS